VRGKKAPKGWAPGGSASLGGWWAVLACLGSPGGGVKRGKKLKNQGKIVADPIRVQVGVKRTMKAGGKGGGLGKKRKKNDIEGHKRGNHSQESGGGVKLPNQKNPLS